MKSSNKFVFVSGIVFILLVLSFLIYGIVVPSATPDWVGIEQVLDTSGSIITPSKTIWDLLELLIVPVALAFIAYMFNLSEKQREEIRIENQNQRELLNNYLKQMSDLILEKNLLVANEQDVSQVSMIARALTRAVLFNLNGSRKGSVMRFLVETDLVDKKKAIVSVSGMDFRGADLRRLNLKSTKLASINLIGANLSNANLESAFLANANLSDASLINTNLISINLKDAQLNKTNLAQANLSNAKLIKTNLKNANLIGSKLKSADLTGVKLDGAVYNNTTEWPEGFDPKSHGAVLKD